MLDTLFNVAAGGYALNKIVGLTNEANPVEAMVSAPSEGAGIGSVTPAVSAKGFGL